MSDDRQRQQDIDDLNNERAGNVTGRIKRFLHDRDPEFNEAKKRDDERKLSALMQLLQDPAYRAAFEAAVQAIDDAQEAVDRVLLETAEATERLTRIIEDMDERAHRLGDEAIYEDDNGRYVRVDGSALSDDESARVARSAHAPSFEGRRMAQDALEAVLARRDRAIEIQEEVINPARERVHDQDNPMSADELDAVTRDIRAAQASLRPAPLQIQFGSAHDADDPSPNIPVLSADELIRVEPAPPS